MANPKENIQTEDTNVESQIAPVEQNTALADGIQSINNDTIVLNKVLPSEIRRQYSEAPLIVLSCDLNKNSTVDSPSYTVKLRKEVIVGQPPFQQRKRETFYFSNATPMPVGLKIQVDVESTFDIVPSSFEVLDQDTGEVVTINCKWLYFKGTAPRIATQPTASQESTEPRF